MVPEAPPAPFGEHLTEYQKQGGLLALLSGRVCFFALSLAVTAKSQGQSTALSSGTGFLTPGPLSWRPRLERTARNLLCVHLLSRARFAVPRRTGGFLSTTRFYFQILGKDIFRVTNSYICSYFYFNDKHVLKRGCYKRALLCQIRFVTGG